MTQELDHSHRNASASSESSERDHVQHPGRASRSALMRKPDHAIVSGLLSRKQRDANGVAADAEHAVGAASTSSGSPLPEALMRKFESSLGADLGGVRVHTGEASATANDAVGAKAYTLGNDIHFGAGQYDPSSPSGEHLLAHEVAHTVQQSGSAQRIQFKLAVSSPGDSHEHEADAAADAMISGRSATVSGSPAGAARKEEKAATSPPAGISVSKTLAKIPLGPKVPCGPFEMSAEASFAVGYTTTKEEGEKPKEEGKGVGLTVGTETDEKGENAMSVELQKELENGWGIDAELHGGATFSGTKAEVGVGLTVSHPLCKGLVLKSNVLTFNLVEWDKDEASIDIAVLKSGFTLESTPIDFKFAGRTHKVTLSGAIVGKAAPNKLKIAKWLAEECAGYASAEALLMGAAVAVALGEVVYGFYDAFSTGDVERISETFGNSCKDYVLGLQAGLRDEATAPPVTPSKWASMSNVRGFIEGKMKLAQAVQKSKLPKSTLITANNERSIAADAWEKAWPGMKQQAIDVYTKGHPTEVWLDPGQGTGNGLGQLKMILKAYDKPWG